MRRALLVVLLTGWVLAVCTGVATFSAYMRGAALAYALGWGAQRGAQELPNDAGQAFSSEVGGTFWRVFGFGVAAFGGALAIVATCAWLARKPLPKLEKPRPVALIQFLFVLELTRLVAGAALYFAFSDLGSWQAANGWTLLSILAVVTGWSATVTSAPSSRVTLLASLIAVAVCQMLPSLRGDWWSLIWLGLFVFTWRARSVRNYLQPVAADAA